MFIIVVRDIRLCVCSSLLLEISGVLCVFIIVVRVIRFCVCSSLFLEISGSVCVHHCC